MKKPFPQSLKLFKSSTEEVTEENLKQELKKWKNTNDLSVITQVFNTGPFAGLSIREVLLLGMIYFPDHVVVGPKIKKLLDSQLTTYGDT